MSSNVLSFKIHNGPEKIRNFSVPSHELEELLLTMAEKKDYNQFKRETGLTIQDVEMLERGASIEELDDEVLLSEDVTWECYFHFLFEEYRDEIDPYEILSNPFKTLNLSD